LRVTVDIPEADLKRLDALAKASGVSRASLIREAIGMYLMKETRDPIEAGFGLWKDRAEDGLAYQRRMREEW
jgi:metal-responsive CopG/Arc/MetJ family transcriptional regulator